MYFSARRRRGAATYRHDGIVVDTKLATATTMAFEELLEPVDCILLILLLYDPRILLDSVVLPNDGGETIAKGIRDGTARAVSDGSFNSVAPIGPSGTPSLNISASDENTDGLEAVKWVPGTIIDQSAYRSELAGVYGILAWLPIIVQQFDIEAGGIMIALDGESILTQSKGNWPLTISQPCFDMLQDIRARIDLLPIKITWKLVEGHQDENKYVALDWWARMNIKMDTLAKEFLAECTSMHPPREHKPQQLLYEKWVLEIRGVKQSSITRDGLYVTLTLF